MTKCPYCGKPMNTNKELPQFTPREFKVYNLMVSKGREYTSLKDIQDTLPSKHGAGSSSVRVLIHYLNKKIAPIGQQIVNHNRVGWRIEEL